MFILNSLKNCNFQNSKFLISKIKKTDTINKSRFIGKIKSNIDLSG